MLLQTEARCTHYGQCGGCTMQHLPYQEQLEIKQAWIETLYGSCEPILGCDDPWHVRNKMEFSFSQNLAGDRFLGLMMKKGRGRVLTLTECHIASPWMAEALQAVLNWWSETYLEAYFPPKNKGALRNLTLRAGLYTDQKMAILTVNGDEAYGLSETDLKGFCEALPEFTSLILRKVHQKPKQPTWYEESVLAGQDHIFEKLHDASGNPFIFKIKPPSFFQPNTFQAERLYQLALQPLVDQDVILDLYCGTGTLGIFASKFAKQVVGIEKVPEAVLDAQDNMALNGVSNMSVFTGDVEDFMHSLPRADTALIDPPRVGLSQKALDGILALKPKNIIYISCNPESQKKNIDLMPGYEITRVQPVDQFPHTRHLENIVFLESID